MSVGAFAGVPGDTFSQAAGMALGTQDGYRPVQGLTSAAYGATFGVAFQQAAALANPGAAPLGLGSSPARGVPPLRCAGLQLGERARPGHRTSTLRQHYDRSSVRWRTLRKRLPARGHSPMAEFGTTGQKRLRGPLARPAGLRTLRNITPRRDKYDRGWSRMATPAPSLVYIRR